MTTRYFLNASGADLKRVFKLDEAPKVAARYNIAPSQVSPIVIAAGETRLLRSARWGFVPAWSRDPTQGSRFVNAKAETVAEESTFQAAFRTQRCLVPANGFFVWQQQGAQKQPFKIAQRTGGLIAFAGVWELWKPEEGEPVHTFAIITSEANKLVGAMEERMPVIIPPMEHERWLTAPPERVKRLLVPYTGPMTAAAVSQRVNSLRNDDAELLLAVREA